MSNRSFAFIFSIAIFLLIGCSESRPTDLLCYVNGEAWHYDKVSGLVVQQKDEGKKLVQLTFQGKGNGEVMQVRYDLATNQLEGILFNAKRDNVSGGKSTIPISFNDKVQKRDKRISGSGNVSAADGNANGEFASLMYINTLFQGELKDPANLKTEVTGGMFSGVNYTDNTN